MLPKNAVIMAADNINQISSPVLLTEMSQEGFGNHHALTQPRQLKKVNNSLC